MMCIRKHVRTWFPCRSKQQKNTHESLLFKELLYLPMPKQKKKKNGETVAAEKKALGVQKT